MGLATGVVLCLLDDWAVDEVRGPWPPAEDVVAGALVADDLPFVLEILGGGATELELVLALVVAWLKELLPVGPSLSAVLEGLAAVLELVWLDVLVEVCAAGVVFTC